MSDSLSEIFSYLLIENFSGYLPPKQGNFAANFYQSGNFLNKINQDQRMLSQDYKDQSLTSRYRQLRLAYFLF